MLYDQGDFAFFWPSVSWKICKKRTQFFSNCKMGMPSSKFVFYAQLSKNLSTLTNQCVFLLAIRKFSWYELYLGRLQNFSLNNLNRKSLLEYRPFALASFHDFPRLLSHATGCYFPSELLGGGSSSCLPTKIFFNLTTFFRLQQTVGKLTKFQLTWAQSCKDGLA